MLKKSSKQLVKLIRNSFLYSPGKGTLIWVKPPKYHSNLKGKNAGTLKISNPLHRHVVVELNKFGVLTRGKIAYIYMTGYVPEILDHINGNPLDDRWQNLRDCTKQQNVWNIKLHRNKKSNLPIGVRKTKDGKYQARIAINRKTYTLGTWASLTKAARAYKKAKDKMHGQFSR